MLSVQDEDRRIVAAVSCRTEREREIPSCAAAGHGNKEIADQLRVSVETVKTHLPHIYQKPSVNSRGEAVLAYLYSQ